MTVSKDVSGKITVSFQYSPQLVEKVKTIDGRRWHKDKKLWSIPNTNGTLEKILETFKDEEIHIHRELAETIDPALQVRLPSPVIARSEATKQSQKEIPHSFEDLRRDLISRKYSHSTVKTYLFYNKELLRFLGKNPLVITNNDIKDYLLYLTEEKQSSASTLNQAIKALKFYYGTMLRRKLLYEN